MIDNLFFESKEAFRQWLLTNHATNNGVWLLFFKDHSSISPNEALEEALCFGWIDGQIKRINDLQYIKKFTPRSNNSKWSEKNKETAQLLITQNQMTESGLFVIEQAKSRGTWDIPTKVPITDDEITILMDAIDGVEPALSNFQNMSPSIQKTYTRHYLDAKADDTRKRRLLSIIERLNNNLKPM